MCLHLQKLRSLLHTMLLSLIISPPDSQQSTYYRTNHMLTSSFADFHFAVSTSLNCLSLSSLVQENRLCYDIVHSNRQCLTF
ncbi:hypothetical protein V1520DRAFT_334598 [Lipomyces starkeyi]